MVPKVLCSCCIFVIFCIFINFYNDLYLQILSACLFGISIAFINENNRKNNIQKYENNVHEFLHDMKTPSVAIHRVTNMLIKGTFGNVSNEQKDILIQINNSSKFMVDLVNNTLTLCKINYQKEPPVLEHIDLNEITKQCISELKYIANDKRCTILFDYSQENIFVEASHIEIYRVISNLLSNAVKYSYSDRIITATIKTENNKCIFEVNSFGDCIDKKNFEDIYIRYKTLSTAGTGIGLYLCSEILKRHNSQIKIISNEKTGNSFSFSLNLSSNKPEFVTK